MLSVAVRCGIKAPCKKASGFRKQEDTHVHRDHLRQFSLVVLIGLSFSAGFTERVPLRNSDRIGSNDCVGRFSHRTQGTGLIQEKDSMQGFECSVPQHDSVMKSTNRRVVHR